MPEILGVTNPVPGREASVNNRSLPVSPNDLNIQNITDPSRVGRSDPRTDQQDAGDLAREAALRYSSNFQSFLQRLRVSPDLMATLTRILSGYTSTVVTSGLGEGLAADLAQFMEMLRMDPGQLAQFLSEQVESGTRFGGALFDLLRQAVRSGGSEGLREDILLFAKRYSDFSSTGHIEGNLMRSINQLIRAIPASWAGKLIEMAAQLQNGIQAGDRSGNLSLLQGQLLPLMAEYVERTHDMGAARALLTHLALDTARYESGSEKSLLQAFHQMKNYPALREHLGGLDDAALLRLLTNSRFTRAAESNTFAERLSAAADRALRGSGGTEAQSMFRELVSAFLVNESVYMPLNHYVIPMEWNGRMMFSEVWVDPDTSNGERGREEEGGGAFRFLFKLDIQSLGFFDVVLVCRDKTVDLDVRCPERVAPFAQVMEGAITRILSEHDLRPGAVQVQKLERRLTITEVFPMVFSGKEGVNVKV